MGVIHSIVVSHDMVHVVPELFVRDQIVSVTIHFVKRLDYIYSVDSRLNKRFLDLVFLQTAHLGSLSLEDRPEWLMLVVIELILSIWCFETAR